MNDKPRKAGRSGLPLNTQDFVDEHFLWELRLALQTIPEIRRPPSVLLASYAPSVDEERERGDDLPFSGYVRH